MKVIMNLNWIKCEGNHWCSFLNLNLDHSHFDNLEGVYIIWHSGQQPAVVYVGQGDIADRITSHRRDDKILRFSHYGLFVTWAQVVDDYARDGVELFLSQQLSPKVGQRYPDVLPIPVNFPW